MKNETSLKEALKRVDISEELKIREMTQERIEKSFLSKLKYSIGKDEYTYTPYDCYLSISYTVRDFLIDRWIATQQKYHDVNPKRIYYISLEFLIGRLLDNNIVNLGAREKSKSAMKELNMPYEDLLEQESDAGLGNGGLGRLAACFLDSMATKKLPSIGYGIRYEFGIFKQEIINGYQQELPEQWLEKDNAWEIARPEYKYRIKFYGKVYHEHKSRGFFRSSWVDTEDIYAIPYDTPVPGFQNNTVNTLRLWSAGPLNEFDLKRFNSGDYIDACEEKLVSENISKVLYPNDNNHSGKELRLKQQYFVTSASLQDILRRYIKHNDDIHRFHEKNVIQLNDTHPAISIVELMRLLIDEHSLEWDEAWYIVNHTFAYTNHTLMPEALEKWGVSLLGTLLPRHLEIIFEINRKFLEDVARKFPGDNDRLRRMSLIEEGGEKKVRMAFLSIIGSFSVNGVADLHTKLLERGLFKDFYELCPEKFNNKTNGITPRRWLYKCNEQLSSLISSKIGDSWTSDLSKISEISKYSKDKGFIGEWRKAKNERKVIMRDYLKRLYGFDFNPDSMYNIMVKRIHEYKRQLLKAFHCIHIYLRLKQGETDFVPRTVFIAGKAAPGYSMAKLIIKFINNVSNIINNDHETNNVLKLFFIPNYRVSLAESLMPAADLSEHISTAGTEASGTSNMKFALNGALTIGTMDGANIEMMNEIGRENMFVFGNNSDQVEELRNSGYSPSEYIQRSEDLRRIISLVENNFFSLNESDIFKPILDEIRYNDRFMVCADFDAYIKAQQEAEKVFSDKEEWDKRSVLNTAGSGKFSSDRTIEEYNRDIWGVDSIQVDL